MRYILAFDQGTTSSRAIVFDHAGAIRGLGQQEFTQHYPHPGWVEHDATEIWTSQLAVARRAMRNAGVAAADIAAIGITNQRETTVLWDRATGDPVGRAIVWQDRRTAAACDALREAGHGDFIQARTGLVVDAYFSATKLAWLLDNIPGARDRAERGELAFGTVDSWLVWNLTGGAVHSTDYGNAARTMLFDLHTRVWCDALLEMLRIPRSLLPSIAPSSGVVGQTLPELLGGAVPIAGVAGDQHAATFGQACLTPGMAKNTYGTGCFMLMNVGKAPVVSHNNLLSTVGWGLKKAASTGAPTPAIAAPSAVRADASDPAVNAGAPASPVDIDFMLEGSIFMAGATVQWLRDGLGIIDSSPEVEALATSVPDTGDVFLVPAFTGLGAPYWDPYARGAIVGMTRGTTKAHIARAAVEAIAFQTAELLDAMQKDSGIDLQELRVDGGASHNNLLMQFQADLLGVDVVRPRVTETTALGAAYLAGLAVGFWSSKEEVQANWRAERRFKPAMSEEDRARKMARWRQAVAHARGWARC
ncbi:glycerol kinase GlpK [Pigmentiphaga litoralis]|uniref:glycerol kinase GlpK n=1 Tax=Pigmentiphaga litoralis TaxID=516702 RepID=UPI003B43537B